MIKSTTSDVLSIFFKLNYCISNYSNYHRHLNEAEITGQEEDFSGVKIQRWKSQYARFNPVLVSQNYLKLKIPKIQPHLHEEKFELLLFSPLHF